MDGDFDTDAGSDIEGATGEGVSEYGFEAVDDYDREEAEGSILDAQKYGVDSELIQQAQDILDGLADPFELPDLISQLHSLTRDAWGNTLEEPSAPPYVPDPLTLSYHLFRAQFCIRRPCRGCKRIYKRCMKP